MKKLIALSLFLVVMMFGTAHGQSIDSVTALGSNPASGQVTCGTTATLLYSTTASANPNPWGRLSITFQNQSSQPVYIAPGSAGSCAGITTSNAGILLGVQYQSATLDRSDGLVTWCCITGSSTATVGWTEER